MHVIDIGNGFTSVIDNGVVDRITCHYGASCVAYFFDRPPQKLNLHLSPYNAQYGTPVSDDGQMLFISSWEEGIVAYSILSNSVCWTLKCKRITSIVVGSSYLVALKKGEMIIKIDINTGRILSEIKSSTIERLFELNNDLILVAAVRGKLSVIDTGTMRIVKQYSKKVVNPANCLSLTIQKATLQNGTLTVYGFEEYPNGDYTACGCKDFLRIIDTDLSDLL